MGRAAFGGQGDLARALAQPGQAVVIEDLTTGRAAPALDRRHAAGVEAFGRTSTADADDPAGRLQVGVDADPVVEHETFAAPARLFGWHLREVAENPAVQLEDLAEAFLLEPQAGFLAADSTGAEHRHRAAPIKVTAGPVLELGEAAGAGIDGALEAADRVFIVIPGIDDLDVVPGQEIIECERVQRPPPIVPRGPGFG